MKHKFNKSIKKYFLKRGEYLYIPSNLKPPLPVYEIEIKESLGYALICLNGKIERIDCGASITLTPSEKNGRVLFKMTYDLFTDITEDEVRFDID
jgi:hypothetical protein